MSTFLASVSERFDIESYSGSLAWWQTPTAGVIIDLAQAGRFVSALAGIAEVLRDGEDPEWVIGGVSVPAAFAVAREWVDSGVEPLHVGDWLRAGCWNPNAARQLVDAGLYPAQLLNDRGEPLHHVETPDGAGAPVAMAVADSFLTAEQAVQVVVTSR